MPSTRRRSAKTGLRVEATIKALCTFCTNVPMARSRHGSNRARLSGFTDLVNCSPDVAPGVALLNKGFKQSGKT